MQKSNQNSFISLSAEDLNTAELHGYLLSAVTPRPIGFVSTISANGEVNLSPFSFFNCFGSNPPLLIFSPATRVRDGSQKHSLENVREVKECAIGIVDFKMAEQMSLSSTEYDRGVNEFIKSGLTPVPSEVIKPPFPLECPVSFECTVEDIISTGTEGGAGNLVICHVKKIHIKREILDENNKIDPTKLEVIGRMGGNYYCKISEKNLFEIEKPLREKGIGVDQLPDFIKSSTVLTGNDLGKLANVKNLPDAKQAYDFLEKEGLLEQLPDEKDPKKLEKRHHLAAKLLKANQRKAAWYVLLS